MEEGRKLKLAGQAARPDGIRGVVFDAVHKDLIRVDSKLGEGTRFIFTLPIA